MRSEWLVGVAIATVATAYVADRIHQAAVIHAGTYAHERGAQQLVLAADRIPKLVILLALGWIGLRIVRSEASRAVAWALIGMGVVVGIAPALLLAITLDGAMMPNLFFDLLLPNQFVPWTGAGLVVLGVVGLTAERLPTARLNGWIAAGAAVLVLAASWPGDAWLNAAFRDAATSGDAVRGMLIGELVLRLGFMAALAALAWLVLSAERATLPAAAALSAGLVVFIGFAFVALFVLPPPSYLGPPGTDSVPTTGWVGRWVAGAAVILGAWWTWHSVRDGRSDRR